MKLEQCFEVYPSIGNYNRLVRLCRQYGITFNGMDITDIESDDLNVLKETALFLVRTTERARKTTRKEKVNTKNIENSNKQFVIDRLGKNEFNDFVTWCNGNSIDIMSIIRTKGSKNELKSITSRYMFILKGIEKQNKQRERFRAKVWLSEHPGMAEYDTLSDWLEKHNIKIKGIHSEEELTELLEEYYKVYEITVDKNGKTVAKKR